MLSYIIGILAICLFFSGPLSKLFDSQYGECSCNNEDGTVATINRLPRPKLNENLLAVDASNSTTTSLLECPKDGYAIHLFSREPLVIYIEGFLSKEERRHLMNISEDIFTISTVTSDGGASSQLDKLVRNSEVAVVPRTREVRCIEARARVFQGWREDVWVERLRTQRYGIGGHYGGHFDWSSNRGGWGRVSSFMVWVEGDADFLDVEGGVNDGGGLLRGGGTEFPLLSRGGDADGEWGQHWCPFIECGRKTDVAREGEEYDETMGVIFKSKPGNAVYWENFRPDGSARGYKESWHLGLPVEEGIKIGLNIWSWGRIE